MPTHSNTLMQVAKYRGRRGKINVRKVQVALASTGPGWHLDIWDGDSDGMTVSLKILKKVLER